MNKIQIRTTKKEGTTPLYMRIKIENKATWVNLLLQVDIQKWSATAGSERKISNLLDKLDYTRKIQEIEFAIKDLRKRHRLTKESAASAGAACRRDRSCVRDRGPFPPGIPLRASRK